MKQMLNLMFSFSIPERRKVQTLEGVTICDVSRVFEEGRKKGIHMARASITLHWKDVLVPNDVLVLPLLSPFFIKINTPCG